jgi:hypothetical protein
MDENAKRKEIEERLRAGFEQDLLRLIDDQLDRERDDVMQAWEDRRTEELECEFEEAFERQPRRRVRDA